MVQPECSSGNWNCLAFPRSKTKADVKLQTVRQVENRAESVVNSAICDRNIPKHSLVTNNRCWVWNETVFAHKCSHFARVFVNLSWMNGSPCSEWHFYHVAVSPPAGTKHPCVAADLPIRNLMEIMIYCLSCLYTFILSDTSHVSTSEYVWKPWTLQSPTESLIHLFKTLIHPSVSKTHWCEERGWTETGL